MNQRSNEFAWDTYIQYVDMTGKDGSTRMGKPFLWRNKGCGMGGMYSGSKCNTLVTVET